MPGKHRSQDSSPNRWVVSLIVVLLPVAVVGSVTVILAPVADGSTVAATMATSTWTALPPRDANDLDASHWTPPPTVAPPVPKPAEKAPRVTVKPEPEPEVEPTPKVPSLVEKAAEGPEDPEPVALAGAGAPCSTADLPKPAAGPHVANHVAAAARHIIGVFGLNWSGVLGVGGRSIAASDHPSGHAVDFMVFKDRAKGDKVAKYVLDHVDMLSVKYVIWYQRINYGDGKGWHAMANRGGVTANHMDHVHVSFNSKGPSKPIMCTV